MLFDSWAGVLSPALFRRYVIAPTRRIVAALKQRHPDMPVIGFPRLAGVVLGEYAAATGRAGGGAGHRGRPGAGAGLVPAHVATQGNLDPLALVAGGEALRGGGAPCWTRCAGGRTSSTWATGSCRRRRPSTWPRWSRCVRCMLDAGAALANLHEAMTPAARLAVVLFNLGGPDRIGGGAALPGEPVQGPGDPARAVLRAAVPGPADRLPADQGGERELRDPGRQSPAAGADARSRPARWRRRCRS